MKSYKIIHSWKPQEVEDEVNQLHSEGWELYGNLSTSIDGDGDTNFAQAMILPQEESTARAWECSCGVDAVGDFCSDCGMSYEWLKAHTPS